MKRLRYYNCYHSPLSSKDIEELLSYIPVYPPYDDWIKIISAVCHEIKDEEEAERLLTNWSPDYGEKTTRDVIQSFKKDYKCTAGTLFYFARGGGYKTKKGGVWNERA